MTTNSGDQPPADPQQPQGKTGTGLDPNVAGLLCYLVGFVTGIIFLIIEQKDSFVRFHAMQSTITFGGLFVLNMVLWWIPILGWLLGILLFPVSLVLWIVLMIKAFQGERFKLPIVGDIAEKQI